MRKVKDKFVLNINFMCVGTNSLSKYISQDIWIDTLIKNDLCPDAQLDVLVKLVEWALWITSLDTAIYYFKNSQNNPYIIG